MFRWFRYILCIIFVSTGSFLYAQVTVTNPTNTTPNLAATYTSLANAVTALNGITAISGPVTITLNAGNPQTTPAGGYAISFTAATTAANNIVIQGNNNVITAFNPQTSGIYTDAIFKLIGVDYVTLTGFIMQENGSNANTTPATNNMTEWGVALLHSSPTDGAQFNIIQNNTISLNRNYQNSFGLYSNARHSSTIVSSINDVTNATTGPNHGNKFYGNSISNVNHGITLVGSSTDANMDLGNEVGGTLPATGNSITNWGSSLIASPTFFSASGTIFGIYSNHQKNDRIAFNTISSASITGSAAVTFRGIYKRYASGNPAGTFTSDILNNTITITNNNTGGGACTGIDNAEISVAAPSATITISDNQILNISMPASGANFIGIANTVQAGILNITNNVMQGITMSGTGNFTGISNTGAVVTALNINNNQIGNAGGNAVTFSAATGNTVTGITVPTVNASAAVSISGNNFQGFVHNNIAGAVSNHTYINLIHATSGATTDNINSNTFSNISVNSSGNVTFITRTGTMASSAGATENCSNNSIVGSFSKTLSGGTVTLFNATSGSLAGNNMVQSGNNFSNITLTGTTILAGWNNAEGNGASGGPTKTITNNVFDNWSCGTGNITAISQNNASTGTVVSGNTISNLSGSGTITGINYGATNRGASHTISNNNITNLTSSAGTVNGCTIGSSSITNLQFSGNSIGTISSNAAGVSSGVNITSYAGLSFFKNKISGITANFATATLYGVSIVPGAAGTASIYNNLVGDLHVPNGTTDNQLIGIRLSSSTASTSFLVYYNTVHINTSSAGTGFGSTALFAISAVTSTTGNLTLRNNILINQSTPSGTGITAAYRRNATNLANFNAASNNNIYYAGTPSSTRLIFFNGTAGDSTLALFKTSVGPTREAGSFTELSPFLSTVGSSPDFLHLDPLGPTQAENGAVNISGFTDDYDADIRQGNPGYTGTGTAPDIGADELQGTFTEMVPPVITYTALTTPTCTNGNRTITGVTITDNYFGVPTAGGNRPRIYYRKNSGTWFSQPGTLTSGNGTNGTWSFTIVVAAMGGVTAGDVVSYHIIAQDLAYTPNVRSNPSTGLVATGVNAITTHPTSPNTYSLSYTLAGTYTVGLAGDFETLTEAAAIYNNACGLSADVVFELIDDTYPSETFPISFINHVDAAANRTLTIRPSLTAVPVITGSSANPIIQFNGSRFIRIDGRQGGAGTTKSLTITNNALGHTVEFTNDAKEGILRYCMLRGSSTSTTRAVVTFGSSNPTGSGNDNHLIEYNDITEGSALPVNGVLSTGTATRTNDNITIQFNNIYNYFNPGAGRSVGIYASTHNSGWTITGNKFYQTAARLKNAASDHYGIFINTGTGYTINNNIIGYADENGNGYSMITGATAPIAGFPTSYPVVGGESVRFLGIACSLDPGGTASVIESNTIAGIAMYTSSASSSSFGIWCGVYFESGNATIHNNIIGTTSGVNSVYVTTSGNGGTLVGIRAASAGTLSITNNVVGGITASGTLAGNAAAFTGISFGGAGNFQVNNNQIGNATVNNIRQGYFIDGGGNLSITGTATATSSPFSSINGITTSGMNGNLLNISGNTLQGWQTSGTVAIITGISAYFTTMTGLNPTADINQNQLGTAAAGFINYAFPNNGFTSQLWGIAFGSSGSFMTNIRNNDFRGISYNSATPNNQLDYLIRYFNNITPAANGTTHISQNTFTDLEIFSTGETRLIELQHQMNATSQIYVDSNRIVGGFTKNGGSGNLYLLSAGGASVNGSESYYRFNDFNNISLTGSTTVTGFYINDGVSVANCPAKEISNNIFRKWNMSGGTATIIYGDFFHAASNGVLDNVIDTVATSGAVTGFALYTAPVLHVTGNIISNVSSTGNPVYGVFYNGPTLANIDENTIHSLSSAGVCRAIFSTNNTGSQSNIRGNKVYNIVSTGTSESAGIYATDMGSGTTRIENNYIGDIASLRTSYGIRLDGSASNPSYEVYYNTVYLNGSSPDPLFSSSGLYLQNSISPLTLRLRNNILVNTSVAGASGFTTGLRQNGTSLANYGATSNNNLFYTGIPSATNLIFYDGSNAYQTLAAFQALVTPRDNRSVSVLPAFISTNGPDADYLHLSTTNNCSILGAGDNTGILQSQDFDADARLTISPFITDIGADEAGKLSIWTGANGTNWNDAGNWSTGIIPNASDNNVAITSPPVNQPVIAVGETFSIGRVFIGSGASLSNFGTLRVSAGISSPAGGITNIQSGVVRGSYEYTGDCISNHAVSGNVFVDQSVNNLTATNDVTVSSLVAEALKVAGTLSFGLSTGKTLTTNNNLVLLSSANATAGIADITGNTIVGQVSVERFINTGSLPGTHGKSWQLLSAPTIGQSIFNSWQEAGSVAPGFGTWITGTGTGFDATTLAPALKFYNPASNLWIGETSTANPVNNGIGYLLFVRGDRTVTTFNGTPVPTILRSKGTVYQPNNPPSAVTVPAGLFRSVGNPYASAIDLEYMRDNGLFVNLNNDVAVWDPVLSGSYGYGGYQTLAAANDYEPTAGGTSYYPSGVPSPFIQSGQAFFVRSAGPAGSVSFSEAAKENSSRLVHRNGSIRRSKMYFRVQLKSAAGVISDGNAVVYEPGYNNRIDADDAIKLKNDGENISILRNGKELSVEARSGLLRNDTIFYQLSNLRRQSYMLAFAPKQFRTDNVEAFMVDRYLISESPVSLSDSTFITFSVTQDPRSSRPDRFYVIFRKKKRTKWPAAPLSGKPLSEESVVKSSIGVYPNPVIDNSAKLIFSNLPEGKYLLQLTDMSGREQQRLNISHGGGTVSYAFLPVAPMSQGLYQLKISYPDGRVNNLQVMILK